MTFPKGSSATLIVLLGHLYMRDFQFWVATHGLEGDGHTRVLRQCRAPSFLPQGVAMGAVLSRKVVTTDGSLTGWASGHEGRGMRGSWGMGFNRLHIHFLELSVVFLSLSFFLLFLQGHHVLGFRDNTTMVTYINRQGDVSSHQSATSSGVFELGGRHAHQGQAGVQVVDQWICFVCIEGERGMRAILLLAKRRRANGLLHGWPHVLLTLFLPCPCFPKLCSRVRENGHLLILIASHWPVLHWLAEIYQLLPGSALAAPVITDGGLSLPSTFGTSAAVGLAPRG